VTYEETQGRRGMQAGNVARDELQFELVKGLV
jgi:hypothetical protein